jgi:hypothetical protein
MEKAAAYIEHMRIFAKIVSLSFDENSLMSTGSSKLRKREIPFISLVSIVIGRQLGSRTSIFPNVLAPQGTIWVLGWVIAVRGRFV